MKRLMGWAQMVGLLLVAAVLSELPWLKQAGQTVDKEWR